MYAALGDSLGGRASVGARPASPNSAASSVDAARACRSRGARAPRRRRRAAARRAGSRISAASACGQGRRVAGRHQNAGRAVLDQLGDAGQPRRDAGQPLALRLHQHVRQAVAVAVLGDLGGEHEQIGLAIGGEHLRLRLRAAPFDAVRRDRAARAWRFSRSASAPPPIWTKRHARSGGSSASAASRSS